MIDTLLYHVAFHLPRKPGEMVLAEAIDFPGAMSQGFDLPDARLMIAGAMEDLAEAMLEDGQVLPLPNPGAISPDADQVEVVPLSVHAGSSGCGTPNLRPQGQSRRFPAHNRG